MISFIWPPGEPMLAGTGGSETYAAGQILLSEVIAPVSPGMEARATTAKLS
jgi:hypothetical protein